VGRRAVSARRPSFRFLRNVHAFRSSASCVRGRFRRTLRIPQGTERE
jgi:hypothetical protein